MCECETIYEVLCPRKRRSLVTKKIQTLSITLSAAKDEPFCRFCMRVTLVCLSEVFFYNIDREREGEGENELIDGGDQWRKERRMERLTSLENRTCCLNSPFRAMTLTSAYSSRPAKTKTRHADIQTSMALIYDTRGNCERIPK